MSATLPDVVLTNTTYTNLYAATGITVGLPLVIQNKASTAIQDILNEQEEG